ncbi:MAG: diacylglycerol kinase family lipid kinase [Actinomycetota bacterium]|nr:diacylglycerol kinase family lipid kinase [Actinomycetota bacterium]
MISSMDAVIIGNPHSGRASDESRLERYADILRSGGLKTKVLNTEYPDHATELAAEAGDRLVVAAGGDGTVNEVVNGLHKEATLGVLPLGTANVLARELGLPLKPERACYRILEGKPSRIDLGVATNRHGEERRFTFVAGIGFDANVIYTVTPRLKRYLKALAFALTAFRVYAEEEFPAIHLHHGDTIYVTQFVILANGRYYGGDFRVARDGSLTSGELEAILVERISALLRPDILGRILARQPLNSSMRSFGAREVSARSPGAEVPVQIDGELWGRLPMSFHIEPSALKVLR